MAENLSKRELIELAASNTEIPKATVKKAVDAFFTVAEEALREGDTVRLTDFGIFSVKERGPRKGRNIRTGKSIVIPASKKVSFRPSANLKKLVNGEG